MPVLMLLTVLRTPFFFSQICVSGGVSCYRTEAFKFEKNPTDFGSHPTYME